MTTAEDLDARYGRTRRRRLPWVVFLTVVVLIIGAFVWITYQREVNAVDADDLSFELVDDHTVTVRFQITAPAGKDIVCAVEALDEEFGVVGWRMVELPAAASHSRVHTERVPTVARATTGLVNACWVT